MSDRELNMRIQAAGLTAEWSDRVELAALETIEAGEVGRFINIHDTFRRVIMARAHRDLDIGERAILKETAE